jgi:hypothetical protein
MQIKYSSVGSEPITSAEVKSWLKIDFADEDTLIASLITQCREIAEEASGLALVVKTIEYFEEDRDLISDWVKLPYPEHDSITEVVLDGTAITDYYTSGLTQKLIKVSGSVSSESLNDYGLKVTYTTLGTCPAGVKLAMLKLIAENYDKRYNTFEGSLSKGLDNFYNYLSQFKAY